MDEATYLEQKFIVLQIIFSLFIVKTNIHKRSSLCFDGGKWSEFKLANVQRVIGFYFDYLNGEKVFIVNTISFIYVLSIEYDQKFPHHQENTIYSSYDYASFGSPSLYLFLFWKC